MQMWYSNHVTIPGNIFYENTETDLSYRYDDFEQISRFGTKKFPQNLIDQCQKFFHLVIALRNVNSRHVQDHHLQIPSGVFTLM